MNKRILSVATAATLAAGLAAAAFAPAANATTPAKVTVGYFNAIPHVAVDVYISDRKVADDVKPGEFAKGPITILPSQTKLVRVIEAGSKLKESAFLSKRFVFKSGGNYSIVGHRTDPTVSKSRFALTNYKNDLAPVKAGEGRVTVRHVAAASPVDVLINGKVAISGLTNPGEAKAVLPVATYKADVALYKNDTSPVLSTDLPVTAGNNTIVYAWGDFRDGTLALTPRVVPLTAAK